ncbi:MAG: uroporphyrinogen decarboxylase/cobalamine-independent methonine synthase family protein, partial [Planctomycetota bacterium]
MSQDHAVLRELGERVLAVASSEGNREKRDLWRRLHNLEATRPLIYLRGGRVWGEVPELGERLCTDPYHRMMEGQMRSILYLADLNDDSVFEPWYVVRPAFTCTGWGVAPKRYASDQANGSYREDAPITDLADISAMREPWHGIDEEATRLNLEKASEAIGDILPVVLDRSPCYTMWMGDLSTELGHLRGIQQLMMDMMDQPDELHRLLAFMRDGILKTHAEAEAVGDWNLLANQNQAMAYGGGIEDMEDRGGVKQSELWGYMAAQEYTLVSPEMHDEFLLQYQLPILKRFGRVAYGCCEDLTRKIDMLRQIPNLRRIAVAPVADIRKCSEAIGTDYVMSYRPNPVGQICC